MLFRNMEVDFDIFDADTAEDYEAAVEQARAENVSVPGETLATAIRRQCGAVFTFFDAVLGEGAHKDIFGERTNLIECLEAFREFVKAVDEQKAKLNTMLAEVEAETASAAPAPNRAQRRASRKITPAKGSDKIAGNP